MNAFKETDYRAILREAVRERKAVDPRFNFQGLAQAMRIQKSYLSKVIGGGADLSADQLYLGMDYLEFGEKQKNYLFLLLEYAKCSLPRRKEGLKKEIERIQSRHLQTKEHISARAIDVDAPESAGYWEYYLDPIHQIVHVSLLIDRYRKDPSLLAKDLNLPPSKINASIHRLEQLGIVARKSGKAQVLIRDLHLPKESAVYAPWRNQLRLLSLQRLQAQGAESAYSFSVVFSADRRTRNRIQARFLQLLKEIEPEVKSAGSEETFQINFDLFSWMPDT